MAKVTITFQDMEDGVSLQVESDPPFPEKVNESVEELSDAQQMALSMTMMFDQQMQGTEEEHHQHQCTGGGGCGGKHKKEGVCPRHNTTPPDKCCQH